MALSATMYFIGKGLNKALAESFQFNDSRRQLERWLKGRSPVDRKRDHDCWLVHSLRIALLEQADGVVFVEHMLNGLLEMESDPRYLNLKAGPDLGRLSSTPNAVEYCLRYSSMSRIDLYHDVQGDAVLRGGIPNTLSPTIQALRSCLKRPREFTTTLGDEAVQCRLSLVSVPRFRVCPLLHVDIKYSRARRSAAL